MPLVPPVTTAIFPSSLRATICLHAGETNLHWRFLVRNRKNRKSSLQKRLQADPREVAVLCLSSPLWRWGRSHYHLPPPRRVRPLPHEENNHGAGLHWVAAKCWRCGVKSAVED